MHRNVAFRSLLRAIVTEVKEMLPITFHKFWIRLKAFLSILPEMPSHVQIIRGSKIYHHSEIRSCGRVI